MECVIVRCYSLFLWHLKIRSAFTVNGFEGFHTGTVLCRFWFINPNLNQPACSDWEKVCAVVLGWNQKKGQDVDNSVDKISRWLRKSRKN